MKFQPPSTRDFMKLVGTVFYPPALYPARCLPRQVVGDPCKGFRGGGAAVMDLPSHSPDTRRDRTPHLALRTMAKFGKYRTSASTMVRLPSGEISVKLKFHEISTPAESIS